MIESYYVLFLVSTLTFCQVILQSAAKYPLIRTSDGCECGVHNELSSRIIGGRNAETKEFPWMAALFSKGKMLCGGSLINNRYVLTAGHCLRWSKKEDLSVILGLQDRVLEETQKKGGHILEIEKLIVHENFRSDEMHDYNDIGLVKLKNEVRFTEDTKPVCFPKKGADYTGVTAEITGWGKTSERGGLSRLLMEANVTVMSNEECRKVKIIGEHITDLMMCAYGKNADACQGDSGGPLIYEKQIKKAEQIGIVSWGIGCGEPGVPGVYTRISAYLDWIIRHTTDATYCRDSFFDFD